MTTRTISLTDEDLVQLEKELIDKSAELTPDQLQFSNYLISRGKAGKNAAPDFDQGLWTWTYRF